MSSIFFTSSTVKKWRLTYVTVNIVYEIGKRLTEMEKEIGRRGK